MRCIHRWSEGWPGRQRRHVAVAAVGHTPNSYQADFRYRFRGDDGGVPLEDPVARRVRLGQARASSCSQTCRTNSDDVPA